MRGMYYVMNGYQITSKYEIMRIDKLMPKGFRGNTIDKLIGMGYILDDNGVLWSPDGKLFCKMNEVM